MPTSKSDKGNRREHLGLLASAGAGALVLGAGCGSKKEHKAPEGERRTYKTTPRPGEKAEGGYAPPAQAKDPVENKPVEKEVAESSPKAPAETAAAEPSPAGAAPAEATKPAAAEPEAAPQAEAPKMAEAAPAPKGKAVSFDLQVGDGISYSIKKMEVSAGSTVTVNIKHTGSLPSTAMGHNFVLLKNSIKMSDFGNQAMAAAKTQYIPEKLKNHVIAHTKLVGGGESDSVTFPAPPPGTYTYLCSFPGHYSAMNGKFVVS